MKEIRFTLGNSPIWHSMYIDYTLRDETQDDLMFAYLVTQELQKMGAHEPAKRFRLFDEQNKLIAESENISEPCKLKFINNET